MADQPSNRPGSLNMSGAPPGRRSNLRLAFPSQGRTNDAVTTNNDVQPPPAYPTSNIHSGPVILKYNAHKCATPPPSPPPRSSSNSAHNRNMVSFRSSPSPGRHASPGSRASPILGNRASPVLGNRASPVLGRASPVLSNHASPVLGNRSSPILGNRSSPVLAKRSSQTSGSHASVPFGMHASTSVNPNLPPCYANKSINLHSANMGCRTSNPVNLSYLPPIANPNIISQSSRSYHHPGTDSLPNSNCIEMKSPSSEGPQKFSPVRQPNFSPARPQSLSPARPQSLSPARPQTISLPKAKPRNLSLDLRQNIVPDVQNLPSGMPPNMPSGNTHNVRDQKKKHLVLHLPPPHHHPAHHHNQHHHRHEGLRERSHKRDRITRGIYHNLQSSGKLKISPELQMEFTADDLRDLGEIGRGGFGTVNKMVHRKSNTIMAVKRIRSTVDEKEQKQLLMDLEVVMRSNDCPCIVQFYGAIFKEGDCWICMELMDTSLDKFYKFIYERLHERLPENFLGKITVATLTALNYLKEKLKIIHRDVKPSNILLDKRGNIKLCDFGISGQLVDSIAKTRDAGCRPYMAPERIDPARARGYDVRSDVWSLGITLMELATGSFPYPKWNSVFEQLTQVVQGEPPRLTLNENGNTFSEDFVDFVNTCLIKEESSRPKYKMLLEHEFVLQSNAEIVDVADYVCGMLDKMANNGRMFTYDSYNC